MTNSKKNKKPTSIEVERKYKVEIIENQFNVDYHEVEIIQTYLKSNDDNIEERVREIKDGDNINYFHTIKKPISETEREEDEIQISLQEYQTYLKRKDQHRISIHKKRKTFDYKNQNFELDEYSSPQLPYLILELEGVKNHSDINFPPFVKILKDVTGNKEYSNHAISLKFR